MRFFYAGFVFIPLLSAAPQALHLPLTFEENRGQFPAGVRFVSRSGAHRFSISSIDAAFDGVRMRFLDARPDAPLAGVDPLPARSNYLNGSDSRRWITGVRHYERIRQTGAYPGIDILYYANSRQIEFDLAVSPGADPGQIRLTFTGVKSLQVDLEGDLLLRSGSARLTLRKPVVYQEIAGHRNPVPAAYALEPDHTVRFRLGDYDRSQPLIVDPALVYATFLGGSGADAIIALATDSQGNLYLTGTTASSDIAGFQPLPGVNTERQVAISSDDGGTWNNVSDLPSGLLYSLAADPHTPGTLYGGGYDTVYKSTDGGKTWRATQTTFPPGAVVPPVPAGAISITGINAIAFDPANPRNLYAARQPGGIIRSTDGGEHWLPANAGLPGGPAAIYINSLVADPLHSGTLYTSTFNGFFRSVDGANSWAPVTSISQAPAGRIFFDPLKAGVIYLQGQSQLLKSTDSGQTWNALNAPAPNMTPVLLAIDPGNSNTLYASASSGLIRSLDGGGTWQSVTLPTPYVGSLAIDPANSRNLVAVTGAGFLHSTDAGATWQAVFAAGNRNVRALFFDPHGDGVAYAAIDKATDLFVAKLNPVGDALLYATYFGGNGYDYPRALAVDGSGAVVVAGNTQSTDFPITAGAIQTTKPNSSGGFILRLNPAGNALVYSTFLGGSTFDQINAVAVDSAGNAYLTGTADSPDFPITTGAWQTKLNGNVVSSNIPIPDAFVSKISPDGRLLYSTFLGGSATEAGNGIAVDSNGNAIVTGTSSSTDFPLTPGAMQKTLVGASDAFLAKLDATGATLLYATLLGGKNEDSGQLVVLGPSGDIFLAGASASPDFPTTPGAFQSTVQSGGCSYSLGCAPSCLGPGIGVVSPSDTFLARFTPEGTAIRWATFVGGECATAVSGLGVDSASNAYFAGSTLSHQFPRVFPLQNVSAGCGQFSSVAAGMNSTGSGLLFATYLDAGSNPSLALDSQQGLYIAGQGCASSLIAGPALQPKTSDGSDGYLVKIDLSAHNSLALNLAANAFSLQSGPVSPGELVILHGTGIGPDQGIDLGINTTQAPTTTLAGVQVLFDGVPVPVLQAQSGWVTCLAPYTLDGQAETRIQVMYQGQSSNILESPVAAVSPGLLTVDGSGQGQLNVRNQDGTLNSPSNPAARGDLAVLFATGLGAVSLIPSGTIAGQVPSRPLSAIHVYLGGSEASIVDVTSLAGFVTGMFQIRVHVPVEAVPGSASSVILTSGGGYNSQNVTIAIR